MKRKITFTLDVKDLQRAINDVQKLNDEINERAKEACKDLASSAGTIASINFSQTPYDGKKDVSISVDDIDNGAKVTASGETVLFLEFGAGVRYGYGHPEPETFGPGTYNPSSSNWSNPNGWFFREGGHSVRSWGNAPAMAMYNARKWVEQNAKETVLDRLAK